VSQGTRIKKEFTGMTLKWIELNNTERPLWLFQRKEAK
jgi:hypothetical protein